MYVQWIHRQEIFFSLSMNIRLSTVSLFMLIFSCLSIQVDICVQYVTLTDSVKNRRIYKQIEAYSLSNNEFAVMKTT